MSIIDATPLLAAAGGDYQISRSVRLRSSASAWFNRTASGSGGNPFTFSCWLKRGSLATRQFFFAATNGTNNSGIGFDASDRLNVVNNSGSDNVSTAVYRDPSAWYHIVFNSNGTNVIVYVNGQQSFTFAASMVFFNTAVSHTIGRLGVSALHFDGYLTEVNFIDGQALTPSSFGETDSITGVWKPKKYAGTYGTNGFFLNFSDNSSNTATTIGKDYSGNGNNWTPNNISVTAGVTYDSMLDVPTLYADGGNGRGNYAVLNPLFPASYSAAVLSNANLTAALTATTQINAVANSPVPLSGKWYWETTVVASNNGVTIGLNSAPVQQTVAGATTGYGYYNATGNKYLATVSSAYGTAWFGVSRTDVIGTAYDADTGQLSFYLNGVSQGVAATLTTGVSYYPEGSHESGSGSHTEHWNFGQRPFAYTPPTGFKALNTQNLPEPTIKKGNQYFDATLYTGNGTTQSIVNSGSMQPDLVWYKSRSAALFHHVFDSNRGANKQLHTNDTGAESTQTQALTSFNSNGFTVGSNVGGNQNGTTFVGWQWKESASAGFDIVTYSGTGAAQTVAHSLGVAPRFIIAKRRNAAVNWFVGHGSLASWSSALEGLNTTAAVNNGATAVWNATAPTSSVFSVGIDLSASGGTYVAYLFAEVAGFSKFGSYVGNGSSTDGPFQYLGFAPAFIMLKRTDSTGNWAMYDRARSPKNADTKVLYPNLSNTEDASTDHFDWLSNGFKMKSTNQNTSGGTFIYAAFAENPFKNSLAR